MPCASCPSRFPCVNQGRARCRPCPTCLPSYLQAGWWCRCCANTRRVTRHNLAVVIPWGSLPEELLRRQILFSAPASQLRAISTSWNLQVRAAVAKVHRSRALHRHPTLESDEVQWGAPHTYAPPTWRCWEVQIWGGCNKRRASRIAAWVDYGRSAVDIVAARSRCCMDAHRRQRWFTQPCDVGVGGVDMGL